MSLRPFILLSPHLSDRGIFFHTCGHSGSSISGRHLPLISKPFGAGTVGEMNFLICSSPRIVFSWTWLSPRKAIQNPSTSKHPVLFWIFGGRFDIRHHSNGVDEVNGSKDQYGGESLLKVYQTLVIYVWSNHRVQHFRLVGLTTARSVWILVGTIISERWGNSECRSP